MRRLLLGLLVLLAAGAPPLRAEDATAVVTALTGTVEVKRSGQPDFQALSKGDLLYEGDTVRTGDDGKAAISFSKGLEIKVNHGTTYSIERPQEGSSVFASLRLEVGEMWSRFLHKGGEADIRTNTAVAAVRGTEADFSMGQTFSVVVFDGLVEVANAYGKTSVGPNQKCDVGGALNAPGGPQHLDKKDLPQWQGGIQAGNTDELLKKLDAARAPLERTLRIEVDDKGNQKTFELKFRRKERDQDRAQ